MITCPDCGFRNIEGTDLCEACQQPLTPMSEPTPSTDIEESIFHDRIGSLVCGEPQCVESHSRVAEVLQQMVDRSVGCVIVLENDEMVGIFTERDALMRLNTDATVYGDRPIAEFMTPHPESLDVDDKIAFALQRMDAGSYRHIPVLKGGRLCGLISVRDVLRYISENAIEAGE